MDIVDLIKRSKNWVIGFAISFMLFFLITILVYFYVKIGEAIYPWLEFSGFIVLVVNVFILLPLALVKKIRPYVGMGIGIFPMALIATAFEGMWSTSLELLLLLGISYGFRFLGLKLAVSSVWDGDEHSTCSNCPGGSITP